MLIASSCRRTAVRRSGFGLESLASTFPISVSHRRGPLHEDRRLLALKSAPSDLAGEAQEDAPVAASMRLVCLDTSLELKEVGIRSGKAMEQELVASRQTSRMRGFADLLTWIASH